MADPRKVPFVTLASYSTTPAATESKKRRREDEENEPSPGVATGGVFGAGKPATDPGEPKRTVRLNLSLSEPNEQKSAEFNYGELIHASLQVRSAGNGCGFEPRLVHVNRTYSKQTERYFRLNFIFIEYFVLTIAISKADINDCCVVIKYLNWELKCFKFKPSFSIITKPVKCKMKCC